MTAYFTTLALGLLVTMLIGLIRIIRGPKPADRMLGVQLSGTTTVAVLLLLAEAAERDALRNVALVFVLLSALVLVAFVERTPPGDIGEGGRRLSAVGLEPARDPVLESMVRLLVPISIVVAGYMLWSRPCCCTSFVPRCSAASTWRAARSRLPCRSIRG